MDEVCKLGKKRAEELGLNLWENTKGLPLYYHSQDIHRLLGEGVEVFNDEGSGGNFEEFAWRSEAATGEGDLVPPDTHQAFLIGIRPIVQESEERKLLREIATASEHEEYTALIRLGGEAKRLLESESGV